MWADNLEMEMVIIRDLVEEYPFVAMVSCPPVYNSPLRLCLVRVVDPSGVVSVCLVIGSLWFADLVSVDPLDP